MRIVIPFLVCLSVVLALCQAHEGDDHRQKRLYPTRCYPGSHCYPNHEEIADFNAAIFGSVTVPSDAQYPSTIDMVNKRRTRMPGIVVRAVTIADVQKAVLFAREFFMNVVTSGSGVDYQGRGTYDGALRIDLSALKSISTSDLTNFNFAGQVTAQPGNTWGEIYDAIERTGTGRVVAGGSQSLDSVDFFTLTGGLGVLSRTMGLAADNLITAQVVLADGRLATVSGSAVTLTDLDGHEVIYEDMEVMPYLRGAGLTWGIPVSFTFALQIPPFQYGSLSASYKLIDDGVVVGKSSFIYVMQQIINLPTQWGGYVVVDGAVSNSFANDKGVFKANLFSYGFYNFTFPGTPINNLQNYFPLNRDALNTNPSLLNLPQWRQSAPETDLHFTSQPNTYVMNVLLDRDVFTNGTKLNAFADLMMDVVDSPTVDSVFKCVGILAGGKVASPSRDSYLNQKYRSAAFSWTCALSWAEGDLKESYYVAEALQFQKRLRAFGNGGMDIYRAAEDVDNWKTELYGEERYKFLLDTKKWWDVDNFLWAHNAVASDIELNCRGIRCPHHH